MRPRVDTRTVALAGGDTGAGALRSAPVRTIGAREVRI